MTRQAWPWAGIWSGGWCGRVRALGVIGGRAFDEARDKACESVRSSVTRLGDTAGIEIEIVEVMDAQEDLFDALGQCDLLILGASDEGFLRPTSFEGFPANTTAGAERAPNPVVTDTLTSEPTATATTALTEEPTEEPTPEPANG